MQGLAGRFMSFCEMFERHFQIYRKDMGGHARHYLGGLLGRAGRKNLQGIEEDVEQSDYQGMQHCLSDSPWDHAGLMAQVAAEGDGELGGTRIARSMWTRPRL